MEGKMPHNVENAKINSKHKQNIRKMKRKAVENLRELEDASDVVKKAKVKDSRRGESVTDTAGDPHRMASAVMERWEVDSGFSSEASPSTSLRSSPCLPQCPTTTVVTLDCEMVGTGPGGRRGELARCSILDYHGNILYDKYVLPLQPVTDYRTRWSGIQKHHLANATPFAQAREEIMCILEGKVVVGHSVYHDFEALQMQHPCHMVRDTSTMSFLTQLAGFHRGHRPSLKVLASKLLNRRIQFGHDGHSSVEDARATLDLYKLVEGEWEQEVQSKLREDNLPPEPSFASSNHYMQDEYWPDHLVSDGQ